MKRGTLVAALLLAGLVTYILLFEREPLEESSDGEKIFPVATDSIQSITIERVEGEAREGPSETGLVALSRDGETWRMESPLEAKADESEVEILLQNIGNLEKRRTVAEASEVALKDFGLDPASVRLSVGFRTESGEAYRLRFGADTPTGVNQYALREDENKVLVIASHLSRNFDLSAWDLRDKAIFRPPEKLDVMELQVRRPAGELSFSKIDGLWYLTRPIRARADRYDTEAMAKRLLGGEMEEIVAEEATELGPFGLDQPETVISIQLAGDESSEPYLLSLGSEKEGDRFAMAGHRPQVFLIDRTLIEGLDKDVLELVSKKLFDYSAFQVVTLELGTADGGHRVYQREGEEEAVRWIQTGMETQEVERAPVENLLYKLASTRAQEVMALSVPPGETIPYGLEEPAFTVEVTSREPDRRDRIRVSRIQTVGDESFVYVLREGEEILLKLASEAWEGVEVLFDFDAPAADGENPLTEGDAGR